MDTNDLDLETIAAFLDGALDDRERERVIRTLGESPDAYDLFVEALGHRQALEEAEAEGNSPARHADDALELGPSGESDGPKLVVVSGDGDTGSSDAQAPVLTRLPTWVPVAIAAGLALLVSYTVLREAPVLDAGSLAPNAVASLPESWDVQAWTVVRGAGTSRLDEDDLAFRMGVRSIDLDVALVSDRSEAAAYLAAELETLAGQAQRGQPLVLQYRAVAQAARSDVVEAARMASDAQGQLTTFLTPDRVRLGRWVGLVRIAALGNDTDLLARLGDAGLELEDASTLSPGASEALDAVTHALEGPAPAASDVVAASESLIEALGG